MSSFDLVIKSFVLIASFDPQSPQVPSMLPGMRILKESNPFQYTTTSFGSDTPVQNIPDIFIKNLYLKNSYRSKFLITISGNRIENLTRT